MESQPYMTITQTTYNNEIYDLCMVVILLCKTVLCFYSLIYFTSNKKHFLKQIKMRTNITLILVTTQAYLKHQWKLHYREVYAVLFILIGSALVAILIHVVKWGVYAYVNNDKTQKLSGRHKINCTVWKNDLGKCI